MSQPYESLEAEWHDGFWEAEEDGGGEIGLMERCLGGAPGRVLEVGSGSGRLLLPLVARGWRVEGLELSADMRRLCAARAAARGLEARVHAGDMSVWQPELPYDWLLVPAFTLQLAADPLRTLRHWHDWLRPGGGLYLTVFTPFHELEGEVAEGEWYLDREIAFSDGTRGRMETRHWIDPEARVLRREHHYRMTDGSGRSHHSRQTLHWFEFPELVGLLAEAGFELREAWADFDPEARISPDSGPLEDDADFGGVVSARCGRSDR